MGNIRAARLGEMAACGGAVEDGDVAVSVDVEAVAALGETGDGGCDADETLVGGATGAPDGLEADGAGGGVAGCGGQDAD